VIGAGSRRLLSLAAREADVVALNFRTTAEGDWDPSDLSGDAMAQKLACVREAAGARFGALELSVFVALVVVTDEEPRRAAASALEQARLADRLSVEQVLGTPQVLVGGVDRIVETLLERRERFGISYVVVRDPDAAAPVSVMEAFAPVVARLAGE
jgi:alkanesulfonate monooxygenase SsuD/methylene tetrahydromethanopterin reductase-like flavin-dependent oxidoreductase (luciferase family)